MFKKQIPTLLLLCLLQQAASAEEVVTFGSGANQFQMTFVPIGNPGNPPDTTGNPNPAGSVAYNYRMGKFEVSRDMVNKANEEGNLGITLIDMTTYGGNGASRPATGVSWNEAARFVNWLNISQGYSPAYKFAFQPGNGGYNPNENIQLWDPADAGFNPNNRFRNCMARYFLPSVHEWYKAAYYDPTLNSDTGGYWDYPTASDSAPIAVSGGTAAGTAVYNLPLSQGPADIDNAGGLSPYGVMGLGGNVWEWEETTFDLLNDNPSSWRGCRGEGYQGESFSLSAMARIFGFVFQEGSTDIGFRVVNIPTSDITATSITHTNWTGPGSPIDNNKSLALEGLGLRTLSAVNLINSSAGITGVLIDVENLTNPAALTSQDFRFQMSPQGSFSEILNPPILWQDAPNPTQISVSPHPTDSEISRVLIRWNNSQIANRWLRLTIKATNNTGLLTSQTYYLGHLLGETTGSDGAAFTASFSDISLIRQAVGSQADASSVVDIDKNGVVSFADITAMRSNIGTVLTNITIP